MAYSVVAVLLGAAVAWFFFGRKIPKKSTKQAKKQGSVKDIVLERKGRKKKQQKPQQKNSKALSKRKANAKENAKRFQHNRMSHLVNAHKSDVESAAISNAVNGANFLASSSSDNTLKVWSLSKDGKCSPFRHIKLGGDWVSSMCFSADGHGLFVAMEASREIVFYEVQHHKVGVKNLPSVFERFRFPSCHSESVQSVNHSLPQLSQNT